MHDAYSLNTIAVYLTSALLDCCASYAISRGRYSSDDATAGAGFLHLKSRLLLIDALIQCQVTRTH